MTSEEKREQTFMLRHAEFRVKLTESRTIKERLKVMKFWREILNDYYQIEEIENV